MSLIEMKVPVKLYIVCARCNGELEGFLHIYEGAPDGISVKPCEKCFPQVYEKTVGRGEPGVRRFNVCPICKRDDLGCMVEFHTDGSVGGICRGRQAEKGR